MLVKVKRAGVSAESETVDDAELLLSLRSRKTTLRTPKRGYTLRLECPVSGCGFIGKNETGLNVHTARTHKK